MLFAGCGGGGGPVAGIPFSLAVPDRPSQVEFTLTYEHSNCDPKWIDTRIRRTPDAYVVSALVHPYEGNCAGVGLSPDNLRSVRLPGPLNGRALVADQGQDAFASIVEPPLAVGSVRRLVAGGRLHPVYAETSKACAKVEALFRGVNRSEWCR